MKYKSQKVTELIKEAMLSGRPREEREKLFEKVYDFMQTGTDEEVEEWFSSGFGEMIAMERQTYAYKDEQHNEVKSDNDFAIEELNRMCREVLNLLHEYKFDNNEVAAIKIVLSGAKSFVEMKDWFYENKTKLDTDYTAAKEFIKDKIKEIYDRNN